MRKKIFSWLAMFMACLMFGGMVTPIANAAVAETNVFPPDHDGYIGLSQYVQHVQDNIFKVQLTLETYAKSTPTDIVLLIDASEDMILRNETSGGFTKTYFENAMDAAYRAAEIWLVPGSNPLNSKSTDQNRVWIIFYNGKAYGMDANVIKTGTKNSTTICYVSEQMYNNPAKQAYSGKTAGINYRPVSRLRTDLNAVTTSVLNKTTDITLEDGAFNDDIKAYQERYTAAGLAAAYDVFADYSKTGNIVTETNRKILYLLSNGPDYERDNVHLNGAGVASMSSSRIPQEGSLRMEALFMAKALKLQMHSYGTGTETSLKTAAEQIAASEGNSYESGVVQYPSLGSPSSYSPLSLDAHRVVIDPPNATVSGSVSEQTRFIGSVATGSSVLESLAVATPTASNAVDSHPYVGASYTSIKQGDITDPFTLVNNINSYSPSAINTHKNDSGLNHWGVVTNYHNGSLLTNPAAGNPVAFATPPNPPSGNPLSPLDLGGFAGSLAYGPGHFEYQMFANTAPYGSTTYTTTKPTDFSDTEYYLSALNTATDDPVLSNPFWGQFTNQHNNPFTSPMNGQTRRPLDGYNYPFLPDKTGAGTTKSTYVYTYADAVGGVNAGTRPSNIPKPNVGPDNVMPLKASYERIAGKGFASDESGGMSVEIWSVGLFAGDIGDADGDPAKTKGPTTLGQGQGQRMFSMGTGYGILDSTTRSNPGAGLGGLPSQVYRWEQGTNDAAVPVGTPLITSTQYYTDYTGYTYGNHTRPTHVASDLFSGTALTESILTSPGGATYESPSQDGYSTGAPGDANLRQKNFIERANQEVAPFTRQGYPTVRTTTTADWSWYTSGWGTWNAHTQPSDPVFGVDGITYPYWHTIGSPISSAYWDTATKGWNSSVNLDGGASLKTYKNGYGAAFSYIPPNPNNPAAAKNKQSHYSPNIGSTATPPIAPASGLALSSTDYKSNGDGGTATPSATNGLNQPPTWFDLIDWHETTGATGTTTQNDNSQGSILGNYVVPNTRHNIWAVATATADMPLTSPGSIPRDQLIYDGTGVDVGNRSELQQHLWAISGVQTSAVVNSLANGASGFDSAHPWQNSVAYYWSKQTFLTTARMRRDNTIEKVILDADGNYQGGYANYAFGSNDFNNVPWSNSWDTGIHRYLSSTVTWRYPWIHETVSNEGFNSVNRDFQNFYEYAGFNYTFDGYQKALDQILNSLRYNHQLEAYDEEDHVPIVKMIHKTAPNTGKLSIYDVDPDELDTYSRLERVFEDLTYDYYRVSNKGARAIVQLSQYFDFYKMPGIPEFEYRVIAKEFPWRYVNKMGGTASYNSGDKKVTWTFDNGVYAGVRYQLSFYVTMDKNTDPKVKYPFQVNSYLDHFNFRSMIRYSGKENYNRYIVTKNFPSSYVYGIKGINDINSNVVIMNDYTPNTIDGSGSVLASVGNDSAPSGEVVGAFPEGSGATSTLQKSVPIYTASVTPAPKKLVDEGVDDGTEDVPVTGIFGVVAVAVVGGLLVVAIVIKRRASIDR